MDRLTANTIKGIIGLVTLAFMALAWYTGISATRDAGIAAAIGICALSGIIESVCYVFGDAGIRNGLRRGIIIGLAGITISAWFSHSGGDMLARSVKKEQSSAITQKYDNRAASIEQKTASEQTRYDEAKATFERKQKADLAYLDEKYPKDLRLTVPNEDFVKRYVAGKNIGWYSNNVDPRIRAWVEKAATIRKAYEEKRDAVQNRVFAAPVVRDRSDEIARLNEQREAESKKMQTEINMNHSIYKIVIVLLWLLGIAGYSFVWYDPQVFAGGKIVPFPAALILRLRQVTLAINTALTPRTKEEQWLARAKDIGADNMLREMQMTVELEGKIMRFIAMIEKVKEGGSTGAADDSTGAANSKIDGQQQNNSPTQVIEHQSPTQVAELPLPGQHAAGAARCRDTEFDSASLNVTVYKGAFAIQYKGDLWTNDKIRHNLNAARSRARRGNAAAVKKVEEFTWLRSEFDRLKSETKGGAVIARLKNIS